MKTFFESFEKTAISVGMINRAIKSRIVGAVNRGHNPSIINKFKTKSAINKYPIASLDWKDLAKLKSTGGANTAGQKLSLYDKVKSLRSHISRVSDAASKDQRVGFLKEIGRINEETQHLKY
jgi:hypothetical protein